MVRQRDQSFNVVFPLLPSLSDFHKFTTKDFNPWLYVNLVAFLKRKSDHDMNGIETIVARKIRLGDTSWIPTQPSLVLKHFNPDSAKAGKETGVA